MSFSPDIRASGNFQRQFQRQKRSLQLSEVSKAERDSLQTTMNQIRTQFHTVNVSDTRENFNGILAGPHDAYFEPDFNTVKIRTLFRDVGGIGNYQKQTINSVEYDSLQLFDQAATGATMWYAIPFVSPTSRDFNTLWKWKVGFHPPQLKHGNSVSLNVGTDTQQMVYISNFGTDFDFTTNDFSISLWIYPTTLPQSADDESVITLRNIDSDNRWTIQIDDNDQKLFITMEDNNVQTKRQFDTPLTANNWYFICLAWTESTQTLVLKVNDNADTSSTYGTGLPATIATGLFFGSYAGAPTAKDYKGYLTGLTYYKTALTSTEMTRLYNNFTKSDTTKAYPVGLAKSG